MNKHRDRFRASIHWFTKLILLCVACPLAAADAVQTIDEPVWVPYGDTRVLNNDRELDKLTLSDRNQLTIGDPRVGPWAQQLTRRATQLQPKDLGVWLICVRHYRIDQAKSTLYRAANRLDLRERGPDTQRDRVVLGYALIAGKRDVTQLRKLFDKLFDEPLPESEVAAELMMRHWLAAALVRLGDDAGRAYFFDEYQKHMLLRHTQNKSYHPAILYALDTLYDPQLVEQIASLAEDDRLKDNAKALREIEALTQQMRINGLPLTELRNRVAAIESIAEADDAQPLHALAERGTIADLRMIEDIVQQHEAGERRGGYSKRQFSLALTVMRCRLWRELD